MVLAVILPGQNILGFYPLEETMLALANQFPESKLIVFSQHTTSSSQSLPNNFLQEKLPRNWNNILIKSFWYKSTLVKLIKKYGITDFWARDAFMLKNNSVSSYVLADEFLLKGDMLSLRRRMSKSNAGLLFSENTFPSYVNEKFGSAGRCIIIPPVIPVLNEDNALTKFDVPYFLCYARESTKLEVLRLLKAFSFFKKRMNSSTKLVILTEGINQTSLVDNFENYKFRQDVHFEPNPKRDGLYGLLHNCMALVEFANTATLFFPIYLAANYGKPVITKEEELKQKVFKDALAYFNSEETLAAQMINMYKDENLRAYYGELGLNLTRERNIGFHLSSLSKLLEVKEL